MTAWLKHERFPLFTFLKPSRNRLGGKRKPASGGWRLKKAAKESNFLQYSAILLTIVVLLLLLNLVVNVTVPHVLVRAAAFITVLTLFEFALVFLDPKIELISEGEPLKKLGINLMIAVFIFPLHSFIESRITRMSSGKLEVSGAHTSSS